MSGYFPGNMWALQPVAVAQKTWLQWVLLLPLSGWRMRSFTEIWIFNRYNLCTIFGPLAGVGWKVRGKSWLWKRKMWQNFRLWSISSTFGLRIINSKQAPPAPESCFQLSWPFNPPKPKPTRPPFQPHVHYTEVQFVVHLTISYANYEP